MYILSFKINVDNNWVTLFRNIESYTEKDLRGSLSDIVNEMLINYFGYSGRFKHSVPKIERSDVGQTTEINFMSDPPVVRIAC